MTEIEVDITSIPVDEVSAAIELAARELGLTVKRSSLARYPGCDHWHFSREGEKGTLEATYWPKAGRLWLSRRRNRDGAWIDHDVAQLLHRFHDRGNGIGEGL